MKPTQSSSSDTLLCPKTDKDSSLQTRLSWRNLTFGNSPYINRILQIMENIDFTFTTYKSYIMHASFTNLGQATPTGDITDNKLLGKIILNAPWSWFGHVSNNPECFHGPEEVSILLHTSNNNYMCLYSALTLTLSEVSKRSTIMQHNYPGLSRVAVTRAAFQGINSYEVPFTIM